MNIQPASSPETDARGVTARLAAFATAPVADADAGDGVPGALAIPAEVRAVARLSLLDWLACGLAGAGEPVARIVRDEALGDGGAPHAALFGGGRAPAQAAALVNGTTAHALDYDDTHFLHIGHPSVAVAPAALAVAERVGAPLGAFLDAYTIGVEASCRLGAWLGRAHYEAGFHQTGTAGAFGATVAAGRLMGLDAAHMAHALGLAATRAGGLKSQFGTMGKPMNAGFAAANGVICAALAARGAVSTPEGIEAAQGFGPTHAGAADAAALVPLGRDWAWPAISHKLHACCHGLHAGIEALHRVATEARAAGHDPATAVEVTITTHPRWLAVCNLERPATGLEAKFSYRLAAAMALTGTDTARLDSYTDTLCHERGLVALRDRVRVKSDASLPDTAARVRVRLAEGAERTGAHDIAYPGDMATRTAGVRAKAAALMGAGPEAAAWQILGAPRSASVAALAAILGGETA
ncbi:MAG: MmgE/PrpD family protein [Pseudomonadota bacterium]